MNEQIGSNKIVRFGGENTAVGTRNKVFYVLAYGLAQRADRFSDGVDFNVTIAKAKRFQSISAVLEHAHYETYRSGGRAHTYFGTQAQIVRVEEIPGVDRRVVLKDCEGCPEGATVKYALSYSADAFYTPDGRNCRSLERGGFAEFSSLVEVSRFEQARAQEYPSLSKTHKIVRIALIPGTSTFRETVLA